MKYIVLASGSKGNSTVVFSKRSSILIDAGIPIKEYEDKLIKHKLDKRKIDAVLLTHEHADHTRSINFFDYNILYSGKETCSLKEDNILYPFIKVKIGDFEITPLPLSHDAINCLGFVLESENEKLVYITDTGYINNKLISHIKNADYYIFESNHDINMLIKSNRPPFLKDRILSDYGHLSNEMASEELCQLIGKKTKEIVFAHVSEEVNTKELVLSTFKKVAKENNVDLSNIKVMVADQKEELIGGNLNE